MSCYKHKRYKAKREPTAFCLDCWTMYLKENSNKTFTGQDIYYICQQKFLDYLGNKDEPD